MTAFLKAAEQHLSDTGELLPGVERVSERKTFRVKFPTAGKEKANGDD